MNTSRRAVLIAPAAAALAASLRGTPAFAAFRTEKPTVDDVPWPSFPHQPPDLVHEVVGAAHFNEDKVRELVGRHPALVNAWWDWGFGDWESPLGAASHMGRQSIARFLIEQGARVDIFAATMLGQLDVVKAMIAANPGVARTLGPHGIPVLAHAKAGGDQARAVVEYLNTVDGAGDGLKVQPLEAADKAKYLGTYTFGNATFEIKMDKDRLNFAIGTDSPRMIHHLGDHQFFPAGVPSVRFRFEVAGDKAVAATITDHDMAIRGTRTQ